MDFYQLCHTCLILKNLHYSNDACIVCISVDGLHHPRVILLENMHPQTSGGDTEELEEVFVRSAFLTQLVAL